MIDEKELHNWQPGIFGENCVRCGCQLFNVMQEFTERSAKACPGRKSSERR